MLRALWTWQRWIGVCRPNVRRIALISAFEPGADALWASGRLQAIDIARHLGWGVLVGGWFSQGVLDLHLLPIDHEPEELCLHRRGLNRRRHLIDPERVGPVLIEFPGKAVDGHLVPFCLFGTEFGEPCGHLNLS